jgi:protoheme IX farnesyltransferase
MKMIDAPAATLPLPELNTRASTGEMTPSLLSDCGQLVKPRLTLMVLFTVAVGYVAGTGGAIGWTTFWHVLAGTALVAAGASALNQLLECESDLLMRRTRSRPLPAGRRSPQMALRFGVLTACAGFVYLAVLVNPLTAAVAAVTLLLYVFAYTPLKRRSAFNTLVGAVPGALPPVIGWAAATGSLEPGALSLFLLLFLWQFPHFWAIAWLYREDYERAGLKMVPLADREEGRFTGRLMIQNCTVLIPASLGPVLTHLAGARYFWVALALGAMFLLFAVRFFLAPSNERARHVLWASLVYLPLVLITLLVDGPLLGIGGT